MKNWRRARRLNGTMLLAITALTAAIAAPLTAATPAAAAEGDPAYYPSGPQHDVPVSTVTAGGWTECYRDTYAVHLNEHLADLLASCSGDYLMLAGRPTGSDTLSLLAAAPRADVLHDTGSGNTTHAANGSEWYYSASWSWGFARGGDSVDRNSCDVASQNSEDRLCWHTDGWAGGYRLGATQGLNDSADYERVVYQTGGLEQQTITFTSTAPTGAVVGDTYAVAASGGASGNPVTFGVADGSAAVCSIDGGTVTFDHPGDCVITADQAGDDAHAAATQAQQTVSVAKAPQTISFDTVAPLDAVVGSTYDVAATGGASGNPVALTVAAGSAAVCSIDAGTVTFDHPGACTVNADQAGDDDHLAATQAQQSIAVSQGTSTTALRVERDSLTATVSPATGAGTPSGTVVFSVGGTEVGAADLVDGRATLAYRTPAGASRTVAAVYSGDLDFVGSSTSTVRNDPVIRATVHSAQRRSAHGWYRTPVRVTFRCTTRGAALVAACPEPVTLKRQAAGLSVTRTVLAADGGAATATVTGINVDRSRPSVRIRGVRSGASYLEPGPRAQCLARDGHSGVATCRVTRRGAGSKARWVATATDRAGNTSTRTVRATVSRVFFTGVDRSGGVFQVSAGRSYTLVVTGSAKRPVYYDAAVAPKPPSGRDKPFRKVGPGRWALGITIDPGMSAVDRWNLGVKVGRTLHVVKVHVR